MAAVSNTAERVAGRVFILGSLGEMGVGIALVAFPTIGPFLISAPLDASGLLVTRMMGGTVLALGITWWLVRDTAAMSRCVAGFLVYNFAIGLLFAVAALATARPALPSLVSAMHLLIGSVFVWGLVAGRGGRSAG